MNEDFLRYFESEPRVLNSKFGEDRSQVIEILNVRDDLESWDEMFSNLENYLQKNALRLISRSIIFFHVRKEYLEKRIQVTEYNKDKSYDMELSLPIDFEYQPNTEIGILCIPLKQDNYSKLFYRFHEKSIITNLVPLNAKVKINFGKVVISRIRGFMLADYSFQFGESKFISIIVQNRKKINKGLLTNEGLIAHPQKFKSSMKNVILIHGFTQTSYYLTEITNYLANSFNVFTYNYDSIGEKISTSGELLGYLLREVNKSLKNGLINKQITIVAHSKGGLVARSAIIEYNADKYVDKLIMLGTPNNGIRMRYLIYFLRFLLDKIIYSEAEGAFEILDLKRFNKMSYQQTAHNVKYITIPGRSNGYLNDSFEPGIINWLSGETKAKLFNIILKLSLSLRKENDGLIEESSLDFNQFNTHEKILNHDHYTKYLNIKNVDHNKLVKDQSLLIDLEKLILK